VTGVVVGSITGLLTGAAIGIAAGRRAGVIGGVVAGQGTGLVIGLVVGIGTGLVAGPGTELLARAGSGSTSGSPQQLATLRWRQLFVPGSLGTGLVAGLAVGLGFGAGFGMRFGLVAGVGFAVGAWLVAGLVGSLSRPVAVDASPLDPWASWRADKAFGRVAGLLSGVLAGLLVGVVVGTVTGLGEAIVAGAAAGHGLSVGLLDGLVAGFGAGLGVGVGAGLTFPQTWAASLAFAQLARRQGTPTRLMRFLEDAHRRDVLRVVGPVYQFRHARLQDRLACQATPAAIPADQATQPATRPPDRPGQSLGPDHLRRLGWVWATGGLIAFSLTPVVVFAPKAPSIVSANALGQYRIKVTWAPSPYATGYHIDNGCPIGECGDGASLVKATGPVTTTEFAVTPGTYQCFEVQAFSTLGTSAWSNYGCTSTPSLFVSGTEAWTDSGVNVPAGITLGLIATGSVSLSGEHSVSPAGDRSCIPARDHPIGKFPAPRLHCWSLIARIGNGAPFEAGTAATVTTTAGRLYLGVNDDSFSGNSGGWSVRIKDGGWVPAISVPAPRQPANRAEAMQAPKITRVETYQEGVLVYFRIYYSDPYKNAKGFGFVGVDGFGWAEEDHPFVNPSYGIVGQDSIAYPFNLQCGTAQEYTTEIKAWIYDATNVSSRPVVIPLACKK
jgi:hypothetical protein